MEIKQQIKFGSRKEDIDDLAQKVLSGEKTATSSLLDYHRLDLKEYSKPGDYLSILDSSDKKIAIVRIVKTEIVKYKDISEAFAIEEGDGNLNNWRKIHHAYYSNQLAIIGKELTENTELVCEWFQVVEVLG